MLKVIIQLLPHGDASRARTIGEMEIANVGGDQHTGEYAVRLFQRGSQRVWRKGSVTGFKRLSRGAYDLVFQALANIVAGRNPRVTYPKVWDLEEESVANVEAMAGEASALAITLRDRVSALPAEGGSVYFVNNAPTGMAGAESCAARSLILDLASERGFTVAIDHEAANHAENFILRPVALATKGSA